MMIAMENVMTAGVDEQPQSLTLGQSLASCRALLLGIAVIMLSHGLQGALLGLRATTEGFSHAVTGFVMGGYAVGFVFGSLCVPRMVVHVGHVRVFAALSSIVSSAALLHAIFVTPWAWFGMRICTGFCLSGIYVVAESWLNDLVDNRHRAQLLSIYILIGLGGLTAGPQLLNLASISGFELFILISVLFSLALVPILLSVGPAPRFEQTCRVGFRELLAEAPLGLAGCLFTGISQGALMSLGAVYADSLGLPVGQVALFLSASVFGGMLLQWPVGLLSDRLDRRWMLVVINLAAAAVACALMIAGTPGVGVLLVMVGIFGGLNFPMYSLSLAIANDRLRKEQMVGASSTLVLLVGIGNILGPSICGVAMSGLGHGAFFGFLAVVHALLGGYTLYRIRRFSAVPVAEQEPYVQFPRTTQVLAAAAFEEDSEDDGGRLDPQSAAVRT